jgi:general secretion pathway protein A
MFTDYWGLTENPFADRFDRRWFYDSPGHEEGLARLYYLIEQERRLGLLSGEAGTGKTFLLELLFQESRRTQREVAYVDLLARNGHDLLWETAATLGLAPASNGSSRQLWRILQDHFLSNRLSRVPTILLFDHVDQAQEDCLPALQRLLHLGPGTATGMTLVLAYRPQRLRMPPEFQDRCDLHIDLPMLDREQTGAVIAHLLQMAGGSPTLFDTGALDRLHDLSDGNPREIKRLCERSLLGAMAVDRHIVDEDLVTAAARDLRLPVALMAGA